MVLAEVQRLLVGGASRRARTRPAPARTLAAVDAANIALISVPGEYATLEAHRALTRGLHVFLFSDHVVARGRDRAQAPRRRARAPGDGARVRHRDAGRRRPRLRQRRAPGARGRGRRRGHGRTGGRLPDRRRRQRRVAHHRRRRARPVGRGGRHDGAPGPRDAGRDDQTETLLLVAKEPEALDALAGAVPDGRRAVAALMGWEGDLDGWEVHPTLEAAALAAAGATGAIRRRQRRAGAPGARPRPLLGRLAGPRGVRRARSAARRRRNRARGHRGRRPRGRRPRDRALHAGAPAPDGRPGHPAAAARGSGRRRAHGMRPARRRLRPRRARRSRLRAGGRDRARGTRVPRWSCASAGPTPTRRTPSRQAATLRDAGAVVAPSNAAAARLAARAIA